MNCYNLCVYNEVENSNFIYLIKIHDLVMKVES